MLTTFEKVLFFQEVDLLASVPTDALAQRAIAALSGETGHHQIAEATEARKRLSFRAARDTETAHFSHAARDQRRLGIVAKAKPITNTRRDGNDVLERAAQFDAKQIVAAINPKARLVKQLLNKAASRRVLTRRHDRRRHPPRHRHGAARS